MLATQSRRFHQTLIAAFFVLIFCVTIFNYFLQPTLESASPNPRLRGPEKTNRDDFLETNHNKTLGFEQILVINRPQRTDRRDAISLAAAYSNLELSWIAGVDGKNVNGYTLPLQKGHSEPSVPTKGSWRAHMNAVLAVVEGNLSSALIMEDDMDWDIRIHDLLEDFAKASRALLQPLASGNLSYLDPTYPQAGDGDVTHIPFKSLPDTIQPRTSPYGDGWDVLWLGHCGMAIPTKGVNSHFKGRIVHDNDPSVPTGSKLDTSGGPATLTTEYPDHTRLIHHVYVPVCSTAYAVSQRGARRILYELSMNKFTSEFDNMLRELCDGERGPDLKLTCLTTQPAIFHHWRPKGSRKYESDISDHGDEWQEDGYSANVRWSVRANLPKLLRGDTGNWIDQYPDN